MREVLYERNLKCRQQQWRNGELEAELESTKRDLETMKVCWETTEEELTKLQQQIATAQQTNHIVNPPLNDLQRWHAAKAASVAAKAAVVATNGELKDSLLGARRISIRAFMNDCMKYDIGYAVKHRAVYNEYTLWRCLHPDHPRMSYHDVHDMVVANLPPGDVHQDRYPDVRLLIQGEKPDSLMFPPDTTTS